MIYLIQGERTKKIKIGFTDRHIDSRVAQLQTGSPDRLVLVGACLGTKEYEAELHRQFSEHHSHGEWFEPAPELMEFIRIACHRKSAPIHFVQSGIEGGKISYEDAMKLTPDELEGLSLRLVTDSLSKIWQNI